MRTDEIGASFETVDLDALGLRDAGAMQSNATKIRYLQQRTSQRAASEVCAMPDAAV